MRAGGVRSRLRRLPVQRLDVALPPGPVLVLAPHPDDESLGCGGLIAQACRADRAVHVAVLTDGSRSHPGSVAYPPRRLAAVRRAEVLRAVGRLGLPARALTWLGEPDGAAPHDGPRFLRIVRKLRALMRRLRVRTILSAWLLDPHGDHGSAHKLAGAAARRLGARHVAFPVWFWTLPDRATVHPPPPGRGFRLKIVPQRARKRRAIAAHRSQLGGVVRDDPSGFTMPLAFLALFTGAWETYVRVR